MAVLPSSTRASDRIDTEDCCVPLIYWVLGLFGEILSFEQDTRNSVRSAVLSWTDELCYTASLSRSLAHVPHSVLGLLPPFHRSATTSNSRAQLSSRGLVGYSLATPRNTSVISPSPDVSSIQAVRWRGGGTQWERHLGPLERIPEIPLHQPFGDVGCMHSDTSGLALYSFYATTPP